MDVCDALIVGAGPAGSTCARRLAAAGLQVRVLERVNFPRNKVCAGWITPGVARVLSLDLEDYARGRVLQPITGFRTGLIGDPDSEIETPYGRTISYGIRRLEFDDYLLRRSGAELQLGTPVTSLDRQGDFWVVNGTVRARLLVGAGGHFCPVARRLGTRTGHRPPVVLAQETEYLLDARQRKECTVAGTNPELYFCKDLRGYGWIFRKGDYLNIGLGREDSNGLKEHVSAFHHDMVARGKVPSGPVGPYRGHAYHLQRHAARRLVDHAVLLVGDAAGLAYTESGEGIRPAVESGLLAAQTVLEAEGDYRREKLEAYQERLEKRFDMNRSRMRNLLPEGFRLRLGRRLLATSWFARHVVMDRWFLRTSDA